MDKAKIVQDIPSEVWDEIIFRASPENRWHMLKEVIIALEQHGEVVPSPSEYATLDEYLAVLLERAAEVVPEEAYRIINHYGDWPAEDIYGYCPVCNGPVLWDYDNKAYYCYWEGGEHDLYLN